MELRGKNMRLKRLFLSLIILLIVVSLSACHGKKALKSFEAPETFDESKEYEISFWAKNDSNVTQKKIYNKAISDFEALYPNIKVTLKSYTDYSKIYNDVITNINTNTTPNVCITYPDHVATYMDGDNIVVPLDDLIDNSKYGLGGSDVKFDSVNKNEVIDKYLNECFVYSNYYLLPFMRSTEAVYINKDYVENLGYTIPDILTWDFMFEVAIKAMEEKNESDVLIPIIYKSTDNMMIQMLKQLDAPYSDSNGNIELFNDETTKILLKINELCKKEAFSTFKISSYPGNFYNRGECIFAIDSTAGSTWIGTDAPLMDIPKDTVKEFETIIRMVPQYDTSKPKMISQGPSLCLFNKDDPNEVIASWLFMQYLITNDVQIAYSMTEGYIPVTNKAINSDEYKDYLSRRGEDNNTHYKVKIDVSKMLIDNINNTFTTDVFRGSASLRDAAGQLIEEVAKATMNYNVDKDYIENKIYPKVLSLYPSIASTYRSGLDNKIKYDTMPKTSIALLVSIGIIWMAILSYLIYNRVKQIKIKNNNKSED